jgi:AAA15 family ATPase/GTPase
MLINFSVSNFGSVKEQQTLSFEASKSTYLEDYYVIKANGLRLLKLGLIYGANASGKTTILNALEFLRKLVTEPADKKTDELSFTPFLFDPQMINQSSSLSIEFIQNKVRYYYEVEFNKRAIISEELIFYKPNKASVFKRTTNLEKQFAEIIFGSKIKIEKTFEKTLEANTLWNNTVLGGFIKTNIQLSELKDATDWFSNYVRPVVLTGARLDADVSVRLLNSEILKADVIQILKRADFNVSGMQIKERDTPRSDNILELLESLSIKPEIQKQIRSSIIKTIELEHTIKGNKYYLPFNLESNGTKRYYGFAGILSSLIRNTMLAPVDELESSLHPDLYRHFLLTFLVNAKSSQLIATTHNRETLDNRDVFRNDAIWFTEKDDHGATKLYSLDDFDSKVIRDSSNIYNAYKTGKLGAVPDLGDYYIDLTNEEK